MWHLPEHCQDSERWEKFFLYKLLFQSKYASSKRLSLGAAGWSLLISRVTKLWHLPSEHHLSETKESISSTAGQVDFLHWFGWMKVNYQKLTLFCQCQHQLLPLKSWAPWQDQLLPSHRTSVFVLQRRFLNVKVCPPWDLLPFPRRRDNGNHK